MPVWNKAHALVLRVYRVTAGFPKEEQYGLTSQMRRAAVSVSSNIAEAYGRRTYRDKARFYYNARGSLYELESQSIAAFDLTYLTAAEHAELKQLIAATALELNRILKAILAASQTRSTD